MADKTGEPGPAQGRAWPFSHALRPHTLSRKKPVRFDIRPDGAEHAAIADFLRIVSVDHMRFKGALVPVGEDEWRAEGRLTAVTEQSCVITLVPVAQTIDEQVSRQYIPTDNLASEAGVEVDLDAEIDDDPDVYTDRIDLGHLAIECLALALDPYPRADGATLAQARVAPPGAEPIDDQSIKPFAKLASLRQKLAQRDE